MIIPTMRQEDITFLGFINRAWQRKKEEGVSSLSKYNFSLSHLQQAHYQGKYLDRMIKKTETGNMLNSALESLQSDFAEKTITRSTAL